MLRILAIVVTLVAVTLFAYGRAGELDFVDYDDPFFVLDNPTVNEGLTAEGVARAFTTTHHGQWQPVSWIAHMLDVELYGLEPAGHHRTSVLLHVANVLLLFAAVARLTRRTVAAAFVALLFAVHPLHVESVAWVSSRKDLVSLLFGLLAVWLYAGHVRAGRDGGPLWRSPLRTAGVTAAHALALMGKPMLVTLPLLLLLLDAWPLGRWRGGPEPFDVPDGEEPARARLGLRTLVLEKLPLFVLSAAAAVVVRLAVASEGGTPELTLGERLANAVVSYGRYLRKAVWPADLAVGYPHPSLTVEGGWPWWSVALSGAVVVVAFVVAWRTWPRRGYVAVGWLWFAGALVPVLGVVSLAGHSMADRYTYLPLIGLDLAVVFAARDLAGASRTRRLALAGLGLAAALALTSATRAQTSHWATTEALWQRALRVTRHNYIAYANLGRTVMERGDFAGAHALYVAAIRAKPDVAEPHSNLGVLYEKKGDYEAAVQTFRTALRLDPKDDVIRSNLGLALIQLDAFAEAGELLAAVVERDPDNPRARHGLGLALVGTGALQPGLTELARATELDPENAAFHNSLGRALLGAGRGAESLEPFRRALALDPELFEAQVNLGLAYQAAGDRNQALRVLEAAALARPDEPLVRRNLGGLLLDAGELEAAAAELEAVVALGAGTAEVHGLIAYAREGLRQWERAVVSYTNAVELEPGNAAHLNNLASALWRTGRLTDAADTYRRALALDPELARAHTNLGLLQQSLGDLAGAARSHRRAIELDRTELPAAENLAWILATSPDEELRDGDEAVRWAEFVVNSTSEPQPLQLATLAAAYAEVGRFDEAVRRQEEALRRMPERRRAEHEARLRLYRGGAPYRDRPLDDR